MTTTNKSLLERRKAVLPTGLGVAILSLQKKPKTQKFGMLKAIVILTSLVVSQY